MKCSEFGGVTAKGRPCTRQAAWGRDASSGRCKYHAGRPSRPDEDPAPPPEPPEGLSEQARRTWRAVVSDWILSAEELLILEGALQSWDTYKEARARVLREGAVVSTDAGSPKRNPAALVARDGLRDYRDAIRQLGLESSLEE